jgi:hypothetical protein
MSAHAPHNILVIANHTCSCRALAHELARRTRAKPGRVHLVAPALNSRLRHWTSDIDRAVDQAHKRAAQALANLRTLGIDATAAVGDANPLIAIEDALTEFEADEIIISTHPPGHSNWPEKRLVQRATERFAQPITYIVTHHGLTPTPAAAKAA